MTVQLESFTLGDTYAITLGSSSEYTSSGSYNLSTTGGYFPIEDSSAGAPQLPQPSTAVPWVSPPVEYFKPWEYKIDVDYMEFSEEDLKELEPIVEKRKPVNIRNRKLRF